MTQRAINFSEPDRLEFVLPYPPSVNHYWRASVGKGRSGKLIPKFKVSEKGKAYRATVIRNAFEAKRKPIMGGLSVLVMVSPPDNRKRDLDNLTKALFDSLTHAKVWGDDSQIEQFTMMRQQPVKGGKVEIIIERM